jgi:hypothetical protein
MLHQIIRLQEFIDSKIEYFNKLVTEAPERVKLIDQLDYDIEVLQAILRDMIKVWQIPVVNPRPNIPYTDYQIKQAERLSELTGRHFHPWQIY